MSITAAGIQIFSFFLSMTVFAQDTMYQRVDLSKPTNQTKFIYETQIFKSYEYQVINDLIISKNRFLSCDFSYTKIHHFGAQQCKFKDIYFTNATLKNVDFSYSKFKNVFFSNASFTNVNFNNTRFKNVSFDLATLKNVNFRGAKIFDNNKNKYVPLTIKAIVEKIKYMESFKKINNNFRLPIEKLRRAL